MTAAEAPAPQDDVLWDVVEEHLAEAQFGVEELERCFESQVATLESAVRGIEPRFLAHVDGLIVGGAPVRAKLLDPIVREPNPEEPSALVVAGFVLAHAGLLDALLPALAHEDDAIRRAAVQALALLGDRTPDAWLASRLNGPLAPRARVSLLETAWRRGTRLSSLVEWLQDPDPLVVRAAARAAGHADAAIHGPVLEHLLEHPDPGVREAALVPSLAWRSPRASQYCREWGLDRKTPQATPMILFAALEGPAGHEEIAALLSYPTHLTTAVTALGYTGNIRMLPRLLEYVEDKAPLLRKVAAQSISLITGLKLGDVVVGAAQAKPDAPGIGAEQADVEQALPPLEEDDLEADLVAPPEVALPDPDPQAVRSHCHEVMSRMTRDQRWLRGKPFSTGELVAALQVLPLRARHSLATVLFVRTGGASWVDTRAIPGEQARRLGGMAGARLAAAGRW
jgi:uncharacterized protein (TIGR02270 family)